MKNFFDGEPRLFVKINTLGDNAGDLLHAAHTAIIGGAEVLSLTIDFNATVAPHLEKLMREFSEQKLHVEISGHNLEYAMKLLETINQCQAEERVLISAHSGGILHYVQKSAPHIALTYSMPGVVGLYALFKTGLLHFKKKFTCDAIAVPEMAGPSFFANQGFVRQLQARGVRVYIKLDNNAAQITRLKAIGVNGFITEDISKLADLRTR